jgi:hypothetical protein
MVAFAQVHHAVIAGVLAAILYAAPAYAQSDNVLSLSGVMTAEGVECPALRGDDGALYTLMPEAAVAEFAPGDRLIVRGTAADASFCQQGTTIEITTVDPDGSAGTLEISPPAPAQ